MRDYTDLVNNRSINTGNVIEVINSNTYPVTFVLKHSGTQKLHLVKAIKTFTGLGLKEAKDFIDETVHQPVMFRKRATIEQISKFKQDLKENNAQYQFNDIEISRSRKLIEIGVYTKDEIIEEICLINIQDLMISGFSVEKINEILKRAYSEINQDKLKEIYNESTLH